MKLAFSRLAFLALLLLLWELTSLYVLGEFWISRPTLIAGRLAELLASGELARHASVTILETLLGLALGAATGIPIGVALGIYRNVANIVDPFVLGLYSLPRVALAPLFIIWFGIGLLSKVMLAFSLVVFVFILNVQEGMRNVDRQLVDVMRAMRASRGYIIRRVLLPASVPWIFAALRIGIGLALIGAVISELIGASQGLGWYIEYSAGAFDTTGMFAGLVSLIVIAMIANSLVKALEHWALRWRGSDTAVLA